MPGPPPISRQRFDDDTYETSAERLADSARILVIVLFRLDLISYDSAASLTISKWRLSKFSELWYFIKNHPK